MVDFVRATAQGMLVVVAGCSASKAAPRLVGADSVRFEQTISRLRPPIAITGEPSLRWTLAERMQHYHVPGVSIAIVDSGRVAWAKGFGVTQASGADSVTPETLFQAGSISKPTFAVGVMQLVQDGRLSLDEDVNAKLISWKVPGNKFTTREKVTLRRILSHSAGLTVHGFPGYEAGAPIPTVVQILNGEKPANTVPVRVDTIPGAISRYSGGGLIVAMVLVTDVTKEPLPEFMQTTVFGPAGMRHSTYEQPLPPSLAQHAASGHASDGDLVRGKYHTYPEMTAGGLWTTPSDLATLVIELQRAYMGRSDRVISRATVAQMFTVQSAPYGIGYELDGNDPDLEFSHFGTTAGFVAVSVGFAERGQGAVIMTNGDQGYGLINEILAGIAEVYRWPHHRQQVKTAVAEDSASLAGLVGVYRLTVGGSETILDTITVDHGRLFTSDMSGGMAIDKVELLADTDSAFFTRDDGTPVLFDRNRARRVVGMTMVGVGSGPKVK
jgi:CubicO group peptidase (beta-lactamase class C family)